MIDSSSPNEGCPYTEAMRRCPRPEAHAAYQPETYWGHLIVAESLDDNDYIYFTRCGLCAGFLRYISLAEYNAHERG